MPKDLNFVSAVEPRSTLLMHDADCKWSGGRAPAGRRLFALNGSSRGASLRIYVGSGSSCGRGDIDQHRGERIEGETSIRLSAAAYNAPRRRSSRSYSGLRLSRRLWSTSPHHGVPPRSLLRPDLGDIFLALVHREILRAALPIDHHTSIRLTLRSPNTLARGTDFKPRASQWRVSRGSMTSSTSRNVAPLSALLSW